MVRRIVASFLLTATMDFFMQVRFPIRSPPCLQGRLSSEATEDSSGDFKGIVRTRALPSLCNAAHDVGLF